MKILSFDCGIKNLAYCILTINPDKTFKIHDWRNINLYELKKSKCCKCRVTATFKCGSLMYCKRHSRDKKRTLIKEKTIKNITMMDLNIKLVETLDKIPEMLTVDTILIEQQLSKNPKMKTFQAMLYNYFIIRGIIDKPRGCNIKKVKFVNSKNKLKGTTQVEYYHIKKLFSESKKTNQYGRNGKIKEVGIKFTKSLLNKHKQKEWLLMLDKNKGKLDDFCDAFLQAYSCILGPYDSKGYNEFDNTPMRKIKLISR